MVQENQRILDKLDDISEILMTHSSLLARHGAMHESNTEVLKEHVRRTSLAEEGIQKLEEDMQLALLPIKAAKLVGAVVAGIGALVALARALGVGFG